MPVLVAEESSDLPFDVQHFRAILYAADANDSRRKRLALDLTMAISETIRARRANGVLVLGQSMMHVDVVKLTRRGSYDRVAVDVVALLQDIRWYEDRR